MTKSSSRSRSIFSPQIQSQIEGILLRTAYFKTEAEAILQKYRPPPLPKEPTQILEHLFLRFHAVAKQLQKRQREREPFYLRDEYDVQDLLHGLLQMYFDDIRPEEYCPSYGGKKPRIDFFLKREQISIEAKMASKAHRRGKISEELILDKEYYQKKEKCRALYCLVYDPDGVIANPRGFESDLNEKTADFEAVVFVIPR